MLYLTRLRSMSLTLLSSYRILYLPVKVWYDSSWPTLDLCSGFFTLITDCGTAYTTQKEQFEEFEEKKKLEMKYKGRWVTMQKLTPIGGWCDGACVLAAAGLSATSSSAVCIRAKHNASQQNVFSFPSSFICTPSNKRKKQKNKNVVLLRGQINPNNKHTGFALGLSFRRARAPRNTAWILNAAVSFRANWYLWKSHNNERVMLLYNDEQRSQRKKKKKISNVHFFERLFIIWQGELQP